MIRKWQTCLDASGVADTLLTDLSKAFDCLPHDLIIAKLHAYGIEEDSLKLIYSYLTNRKQRTRIESKFGSWLDILLGVPQGSILGPLIFNIFVNDLLLILMRTEICNFADDNTIYSCASTYDVVMENLKSDLQIVFDWCKVNQMIANPSKFQFIFWDQNVIHLQ